MLIVTLALIEKDDHVLLIQEAMASCRGKWFLPGGRLDPGESLTVCLKREVKEEAGLDVEPVGLLYLDQMIADGIEGEDRLRFVFRARPVGGLLKSLPDSHSLGAQWYRRDEIERLSLRSPIVSAILSIADSSPALLPISSFQAQASSR